MKYNRYRDTIRKDHRSSESANNLFYVKYNWQKIALRVTNTTELPYPIKKGTQIAELSVVTPEHPKFINPVDTAVLSMIPESDSDPTNYLNEMLRTNKPKQQKTPFGF